MRASSASSSYLHPHYFLVRLNYLVPDLEHELKGELRFLDGDHRCGKVTGMPPGHLLYERVSLMLEPLGLGHGLFQEAGE
jgi:hypothetical protein